MKYQTFYQANLPDMDVAGKEGKANCPFHPDQDKTFNVNLDSGYWKCGAGCGEGNHIMFCEKKGIGIEGTPEYQYLMSLQSNPGGIPMPDNSSETAQKLKQMMAEQFPGFGLMMNPSQMSAPMPESPPMENPVQNSSPEEMEARRYEIAKQLKEKIEEKLPDFAQMMSQMQPPQAPAMPGLFGQPSPAMESEDPVYQGEMMKIDGEAMMKKGKLLMKKGDDLIRKAKKTTRPKKKK